MHKSQLRVWSALSAPPPPHPTHTSGSPFPSRVPRSVLEGESTRAAARKAPVDPAAIAAAERERKAAEEDGIVIANGRRTIASQTVYRESEAQTDPYTPEYVLTVKEPAPEILMLAHMKAGSWWQLPRATFAC
jgi:hypothetical protein